MGKRMQFIHHWVHFCLDDQTLAMASTTDRKLVAPAFGTNSNAELGCKLKALLCLCTSDKRSARRSSNSSTWPKLKQKRQLQLHQHSQELHVKLIHVVSSKAFWCQVYLVFIHWWSLKSHWMVIDAGILDQAPEVSDIFWPFNARNV
jgi:hypothetical protein